MSARNPLDGQPRVWAAEGRRRQLGGTGWGGTWQRRFAGAAGLRRVCQPLHTMVHPASAAAAAADRRGCVDQGTCAGRLLWLPLLGFRSAELCVCLQHWPEADEAPGLHTQQQQAACAVRAVHAVLRCGWLTLRCAVRRHDRERERQSHRCTAQAVEEPKGALGRTQGEAGGVPAVAAAVAADVVAVGHTAPAHWVGDGAVGPEGHGHVVPVACMPVFPQVPAVHEQSTETAVLAYTDACHAVPVGTPDVAAVAQGRSNVYRGLPWWVGLGWVPAPLCC